MTILLCAGPDFEDRELFYPYYRFLEAGYPVLVAGLGETIYKGKCGLAIEASATYAEVQTERFDAVIIPGGWAPDKIRMDEAALKITRNTLQQGGVVAAICHGGWVLTSANVVSGKRVTSYRAIKDDMTHAGGLWEDSEVVVDTTSAGTLITSRKPDDLPAFCKAVLQALALKNTVKQ